jgi:hypothetical protein
VCNRACVTVDEPAPRRSVYRVRRAYFARALGRSAIVTAVLVLLVTVCLEVGAPGVLTTVLVFLTTIGLVVVAWIAISVMLPPTLLQLDVHGFRANKRYTSGPRTGSWFDVRNVASQQTPDGVGMIMQHEDGTHTAVPLSLADADAVTIEKDVRERLNQAHGYRSLP